MAKNDSVRGLFLWSVNLSGDGTLLWVTTRKRDLVKATQKASKALARAQKHGEVRTAAQVKGIECHGTIDA